MPPRRKKSTTGRIKSAAQSAATASAKRIKSAAHSAAAVSAEKTKEAVQFVYKHRKKIMDALELIAAVVGTASTVVGKPSRSGRTRRRKR